MNTKFVIRRIGVLSMAKMMGVLYALLGLIIGAFVSLIALVGSALGSSSSQSGMIGAVVGIAAIIVFPILYGIIGFLGGLITAWLYNLVAGMIGGIELEGVQTNF